MSAYLSVWNWPLAWGQRVGVRSLGRRGWWECGFFKDWCFQRWRQCSNRRERREKLCFGKKNTFFASHFVVIYRRNCLFVDYMYGESGVHLYLYLIYVNISLMQRSALKFSTRQGALKEIYKSLLCYYQHSSSVIKQHASITHNATWSLTAQSAFWACYTSSRNDKWATEVSKAHFSMK